MTQPKLRELPKSCPFCGGVAERYGWSVADGGVGYRCKNKYTTCPVGPSSWADAKSIPNRQDIPRDDDRQTYRYDFESADFRAITAWNTRATDGSAEDLQRVINSAYELLALDEPDTDSEAYELLSKAFKPSLPAAPTKEEGR